MNFIGNAEVNDRASLQLGDTHTYHTEVHNYIVRDSSRCLFDLRSTLIDPRGDKRRIEQMKGGLLRASYSWILGHEDFKRWQKDEDIRLLWINGDAGKGKTMLLCGIINELMSSRSEISGANNAGGPSGIGEGTPSQSEKPDSASGHHSRVLFFFCQGIYPQNHATAVLRSLIYLMICQQPSLISHLQEQYDHAGRQLFEDINAFFTLSQILTNMLSGQCYTIIIDALDECEVALNQLLDYICHTLSSQSHVKWIVSSRKSHEIEQHLYAVGLHAMLSLELNARHITKAIDIFIDHKVRELSSLRLDEPMREQVRNALRLKANGTFLWVALVIKKLQTTQSWNMLDAIRKIPAGLQPYYRRMLMSVQKLDEPMDRSVCQSIISTATLAYRPLQLSELAALSTWPGQFVPNSQSVEEAVNLCGSFLTIQNDYVYLIHQTVKDFLLGTAANDMFPSGVGNAHHAIFLRSMNIMSEGLGRDMYGLVSVYTDIEDAITNQHTGDTLASTKYPYIYWVKHLHDAMVLQVPNPTNDLGEGGVVYQFLEKKYLYWLEALSLLRSMSEGVVAMQTMKRMVERLAAHQIMPLVRDALRFIRYHRRMIEDSPLQVYSSALLFSPIRSKLRQKFWVESPNWMTMKSTIPVDWDNCLEVIPDSYPSTFAISADNKRLALGTCTGLIKVLSLHSGAYLQKIGTSGAEIRSVSFSADGHLLASGSGDGMIRIWDAVSGIHCYQFQPSNLPASPVIFSADSQLLASGFDDQIMIWDVKSGSHVRTLDGGCEWPHAFAFSTRGHILACCSMDGFVKTWDIKSGDHIKTIESNRGSTWAIAFSPNGQFLALGFLDSTIEVWDTDSGSLYQTLEGHFESVTSINFAANGQQLASSSIDGQIKIWDQASGTCLKTMYSGGMVSLVAFTSDGQFLVSISDGAAKIWDAVEATCPSVRMSHWDMITSITFSADGTLLATGSQDDDIKIWEMADYKFVRIPEDGKDEKPLEPFQTLVGHEDTVISTIFLANSLLLASGSCDGTVRVWDVNRGGICIHNFDAKCVVTSVTFSEAGQLLISGHIDGTLRFWSLESNNCLEILQCPPSRLSALALSLNSQWLAIGCNDVIQVWDMGSSSCCQTFQGHKSAVRAVTFSTTNEWLISSSEDSTLKFWDVVSGVCYQTFDVGVPIFQLSVDPTTNSHLSTSLGVLNMDLSSAKNKSPVNTSAEIIFHGYGVGEYDSWIVKDGEPVLQIHPDFVPSYVAVKGSTVAIGCRSGHFLIMRFTK